MNLKNSCCGVSARTGTLFFSYVNLIYSGWSLLSLVFKLKNPIYKAFFDEFPFIFCGSILFDLIGISIFLIIIVFGCCKTSPCISLLNAAIVFLILREIYTVYCTFQLTAAIDHLADVIIDEDIQGAFRNVEKEIILDIASYVLKRLYVVVTIEILIGTYSILVFYGYKTELKENPVYVAPVRRKIEEAKFSQPSAPRAFNFQMPDPRYQYCTQ